MIGSFFFKKLKPKKNFALLTTCFIDKVGLLLFCFAVLEPFRAFAVCTIFIFRSEYFSCCFVFFLRFFLPCSIFVNKNSVVVFVTFFLALLSVLLFSRFCVFFCSPFFVLRLNLA